MAQPTTRRPPVVDRALAWAQRRPQRLAGHNPWEVMVVTGQVAARGRVVGTAAEMAFFAVLALVPLTVAFGAALGYLGRILGPERVLEGHDAVVAAVVTLLGAELATDTIAPYVRRLLEQQRGGLALTGLVVTFWLASRVFTPAMSALDRAYGTVPRRSPLRQRLLGLGLAVGSMLASCVTLVLMIAGPLVTGVRHVAERLDVGRPVELAWTVGRWPLLLAIVVGFVMCFYRYAPSHRPSWRECLPGAAVGVLSWVLVAGAFRGYLAASVQPGVESAATDDTVAAVGRAVSAVVATMLWTFLSSLVLLVGGVLNATIARRCRPPA